jgi:hypothetical protein
VQARLSLQAGNFKDSLKAGAIGAVTAGAVTGVTQGASAFKPTTPTPAPLEISRAVVDNTAGISVDLSATAAETVATGVPMPMDPLAAGPTGMPMPMDTLAAGAPAPSIQYTEPFAAPGGAVTRVSTPLSTSSAQVQSGGDLFTSKRRGYSRHVH